MGSADGHWGMHVAIIMHGTGKWARQRGQAWSASRAAGVAALRTTVGLAASARVRTLTLYCICTPDGTRPRQEVVANIGVLDQFLRGNLRWCLEESVRISLIGSSGRLNWLLPPVTDHNEHLGLAGSRTHLRIVVDYSGHDSITQAAWRNDDSQAPERFDRQLSQIDPTALPAGAVDLLVRTGGGWYCSDFMLWELAYAKLHVVNRLWPDFTASDFQQALNSHATRNVFVPIA
jgi:undecaprenyl diphosphate synthase